MFQVERNAKIYGENLAKELKAKGVSARSAELQGKMAEQAKIKRGNAWIKANVGLN